MKRLGTACLRLMAAVLIVALVCVSIVGCGRTASESWTICLYLCGSDLETEQGWASKALDELSAASLPKNVTVVVQAGGANTWHSDYVDVEGRRLVFNDGQVRKVEPGLSGSMGTPAVLEDFLTYCAEQHAAERFAVILWDHGGGPLKGACFDERKSFDALSLEELQQAIEAGVKARDGEPYDVVGFDACIMGSLETAITLQDYARYLVASQEIEMGAGWDFGAFAKALGEKADAQGFATGICDSYLDKCKTRGTNASATLSVVDLSKVAYVEKRLDVALSGLADFGLSDAASLRLLAYGARLAQSFGGRTNTEGAANLLDLKGFATSIARYSSDSGPWQDLAQAVDEAVVYNKRGEAATGASGLSLWYPVRFQRSVLADYAKKTPLEQYAHTLVRLFAPLPKRIEFANAGTVEDERFVVTIDPESRDSLYDVYVVNRRVDGTYEDNNVDIDHNWEGGTFSYAPRSAVRVVVGDLTLDTQAIVYDEDQMVFSSPVVHNGSKTNLRLGWLLDNKRTGEGHYEVLGTWRSAKSAVGFYDRSVYQLEEGDTIEALSLDGKESRGTMRVGNALPVGDVGLKPGKYQCWFVAVDLYGNEYASNVLSYKVTKDKTVIEGIVK